MLSLLRAIKFALQDIGRNLGLSFMTVLILVLMLLSINTLFIINVLTSRAVQSIKDQIDISVYFSPDASQAKIDEIKNYINAFPEIKEIIYQDKEKVLADFKAQHKDNAEILASLSELGSNPFGPTMIIKTREPKDYEKIVKALSVPEYESLIEAKTFGDTEKAIERVHTITTQVERFTAGVSALFAIIAFLIIFNTIRVAIYTQRVEITIKKLVGATNWFIRAPYVIESFIFAFVSVLVASSLVYLSLRLLDPYIKVVFGESGLLTNYYSSNTISLLGMQFLAVLLLTVFSSFLAMRKHLRA